MKITVAGYRLTALAWGDGAKLYPTPPYGWIRATLIDDDTMNLDFMPERSIMNITLHGKPSKPAGELEIGEHGFAPAVTTGYRALPSHPALRLYPVMTPPMGDCYRVTRVDDETLDMEFVPAVGNQSPAMDEIVVAENASHLFQARIRELQKEGWRVDTGSLYITHGRGVSSFVALMHREVQGE